VTWRYRRLLLNRRSYNGVCWWCGGIADSREHQYKRADVVREFGSGPYSGLVRWRGADSYRIRGPNSNVLKFGRTLCQPCNNVRSQPFDQAYDSFIEHLRANERQIILARVIHLPAVWGNWTDGSVALARYFVKHIGCRLADADVEVPAELIGFLDGQLPLRSLLFGWEIRADLLVTFEYKQLPPDSLWLGGLRSHTQARTGDIVAIDSHVGYRWFRLSWVYDDRLQSTAPAVPGPDLALNIGYSTKWTEIARMGLAIELRRRREAVSGWLRSKFGT